MRQRAEWGGLSGLRVSAAFLGHSAPSPRQALDALPAGPVVVLPLLLTAAYHSETDIPAALRAIGPGDGLEIRYGRPLGPQPLLIGALERRLRETSAPMDPAQTSVVLAAAGSSDPATTTAITALAAHWRAQRGWRDVAAAYATSTGPTPAAAVAALSASGARRVLVASYLLAPGRFASQIRDQALGAGATAVSDVLGATPELATILLQRYRAAAFGLPPAALSGTGQARIA